MKTICSALFISALFIATNIARAAEPPEFVKDLTGCFMVTYRFVEDGKHDLLIKDAPEEVKMVSDEHDHYVLQHYGIQEGEKFKHWSEEWYPSEKDKNEWSQRVYSPGGRLRYQCDAPFVFNQWHCAINGAPKPQRDKERADYDLLNRQHNLQITSKGWVQAEINVKVKKDGTPVANELGWIEYQKVDAKKCEVPASKTAP